MPDSRAIDDAVCPACGLLCDDITLTVDGGRIIEARNACGRGRSWFLDPDRLQTSPAASIDGREVSVDQALDRAAAILRGAKGPIVTGLSGVTVEAQEAAVAIAEAIGAVIDPAHAKVARPRVSAIRRSGATLASFGEVANRADLVVLWGGDLEGSYPRLRERLIDRPGRFVPGARAGRVVLNVDEGGSTARSWADDSIAVLPGGHAEILRGLRASLVGVAADADRLRTLTGIKANVIEGWADRFKAARYGAILFGDALSSEGPAAIEALLRLVDDLNVEGRVVVVPLAGPGNPIGAEAVLTARLGSPIAVDLSDGSPRHRPGDADADHRLGAGEADAVLIVGEDRGVDPGGVAVIRIGPNAMYGPSGPSVVAIATAEPGIDARGTFERSDEVALTVRPVLPATRPEASAVLGGLLERLRD